MALDILNSVFKSCEVGINKFKMVFFSFVKNETRNRLKLTGKDERETSSVCTYFVI